MRANREGKGDSEGLASKMKKQLCVRGSWCIEPNVPRLFGAACSLDLDLTRKPPIGTWRLKTYALVPRVALSACAHEFVEIPDWKRPLPMLLRLYRAELFFGGAHLG